MAATGFSLVWCIHNANMWPAGLLVSTPEVHGPTCTGINVLELSSYTVAVCDCVFHLYDFFLLLSTLQRLISLTCLDRFWPNLVPSTPAPPKHDPGVKGHVGVTGVKKVIFTKIATSPTDYRVWSCDSRTCISLTPSTKVMGLKIHPGSFGVTGVKKVIFTKNATSPTNYRVWSCDSCTYISLTPSTKVMGLKIHPGSFGVTGVKRSFSLKTLLLLQFTGYGHVTHVHTSDWLPLQTLWV